MPRRTIRPLFSLLLLAGAAAFAASCDDPTRSREVATVEVSAPSDRLEIGKTLHLTATARNTSGASINGVEITWSSSDESIASVTSTGAVTGKAAGPATIRAAAGGKTGEVSITVAPPAVATVAVVPDTATLTEGSTRKFTVTLRDGAGTELTGRTVAWSSDADTVARVAADGTVTAQGRGTATITAESEGKKGTAKVTVVQPPVPALRLELVASGVSGPAYVTAPPGDRRLFVVGLDGKIMVVQDGQLLSTPFVDLTDRVVKDGERGLLSLAFHPQYASNGYFYVYYNHTDGSILVERYRVSSDPNRADRGSARPILRVDGTTGLHNGGLMKFGSDGRLYIGTGDGGNPANAQDRGSLMGKFLRIDVDAGDPYAIPADNPFVGQPGARGEIWAVGLRNPWRWSFDRATGLLYTGDVGQNGWEEVNVVPAGQGGLNYGWPRMEGAHCYPAGSTGCDRTGVVLPALEYAVRNPVEGNSHPVGCAVIGGYVYRGSRMPGLRGHYFYADFCKMWIRSFRYENGRATDLRDWTSLGGGGNVGGLITSFGQDAAGELYVLASHRVYRIVPSN